MSAINTGPIDVNYPVPGVNNNSQGFRTNFASIKNNLTVAGNEISDLQNKAVLKSALTGTSLNNNMANALISNAAVQGFRSTTFNLGSNLANTVIVDCTNGDVQYGTIAADVQIEFARWAPTGTQSNVELILSVANTSAVVNFPTNVNQGLVTIENYQGNGAESGGNVGLPVTADQVHYRFSTVDCGDSITIEPVNLPRQSSQIIKRIINNPIGRIGDTAGFTAIGAGGSVNTITLDSGGTGYQSATVLVSAPQVDGGIQATATATIVAGVITQISIVQSGSGYLETPTVSIVSTGSALSPGTGAAATATLDYSDNYFYYCYRNYDGINQIWNRVSNQPW